MARTSVPVVTTVVLLWITASTVCGQEVYDEEKTYYDAEFATLYLRYEEALPLFLKVLENGLDNANIRYKIGYTYVHIPGKKAAAIPYLEEAILNTSHKYRKETSFKEKRAPVEAHLYLGAAYQSNEEISKAQEQYRIYKELVLKKKGDTGLADHKLASCETALAQMANPVDVDARLFNLTGSTDQYNAVFSADGKTMVFMENRTYYEGIYFSQQILGEWTPPRNITMEVESDGKLEVSSLSSDGTQLLFSYNDGTGYDLFISAYDNGRWTKATPLAGSINSLQNEIHAVLEPSGSTLYFVSDRKGGQGGFDIYFSTQDPSGKWGIPANLGPVINTVYNENTPFFDRNGLLYFSSEGHNTMGGYDIYASSGSNTRWTTPENLGYPVNTTEDDLFFVPVKDAILAYKTQFKETPETGRAIYEYEFYSDAHPRTVTVEGRIRTPDEMNLNTGDLLINVTNHEGLAIIENLSPDSRGRFRFVLPAGVYQLTVTGDRMEPLSETLEIGTAGKRSIELDPAWIIAEECAPEQYSFEMLFFEFNKTHLSPTACIQLDILAEALKTYPGATLTIEGHTDAIGSELYNKKLGEKRAASASAYLRSKGILPGRIRISSAGESSPLARNTKPDGSDDPEGRKYNRRVSISIEGVDSKNIIQTAPDIPAPLRIR